MRLGLILECISGGADEKVYKYLAKKLRSDIEIEVFPLGNKGALVSRCGEAANWLFEVKCCEKIIIIWDFHPFWEAARPPPCPIEDCQRIRQKLEEAKITAQQMQRVSLVCIQNMLETLLLFDKKALCDYLGGITGRLCDRVKIPQHPERHLKPKKVLKKIFADHHAREYEDWRDNEHIIELVDINKLRKCPAFQRFERRIKAL